MRIISLSVAAIALWSAEALSQHSASIIINAGFLARAADTPAKLARLKSFPRDKFVARKTAAGATFYIYADPDICVCAYVGSQQAMAKYREQWALATRIDRPSGAVRGGQFAEDLLIHDMQGDDAENDFDYNAFHPGF